ncbi:MAG: hypothetical protein ACT4O1_13620 [Gemmatimonadota bacterium]
MRGVSRAVRWWAKNWALFVESSRGPVTDLVGPNPWGPSPRQQGRQIRNV